MNRFERLFPYPEYVYVCMCVCMYVCMYACMYVHIRMYVAMDGCMCVWIMYVSMYAGESQDIAKFVWGDRINMVRSVFKRAI